MAEAEEVFHVMGANGEIEEHRRLPVSSLPREKRYCPSCNRVLSEEQMDKFDSGEVVACAGCGLEMED